MKHLPLEIRYENHCHANIRSYCTLHSARSFTVPSVNKQTNKQKTR